MLDHLQTEARNPASARLDELTSLELVELMTSEDATIPSAVATQRQAIAQAIDVLAERLRQGGRLIYCGAGTSGRLGVLDASECPPTFQTDPNQILGLIAGGPGAMFRAVEGAEDSRELGASDMTALNVGPKDVVCGIASSGRTPYVIGALRYARSVRAYTFGVVCTTDSEIGKEVDLLIAPVVGAEILTGSTRLKAGTATKLVLNMLTTGAMVRLGKTFGNLMVDLKATNSKLVARANRIVRTVTGLSDESAVRLLESCGGEVKTAIVSHVLKISAENARQKLQESEGRVRLAIGSALNSLNVASVSRPLRNDLVLGIDGGGTGTRTLLADRASGAILGRGEGGPSNIQSVGVDQALAALDASIEQAFRSANIPRAKVAAIGLGMAGIDRQEGLDVINGWAARSAIAEKVTVANDATLLLAAGTPNGYGLAVIAGTGSIAFVRTETGEIGRCGGWGYTLGDEGSAYQIALRALRAACRSHDKCAPPTLLLERFLLRMCVKTPPDLIPVVYRGPWDRAAIAGMAPLVLTAAEEGDAVANEIVRSEVQELARTALGAVTNSNLPRAGLPIAIAGGLLLHSDFFRRLFIESLTRLGIVPGVITPVEEPATGAVVLARHVAK